MTNDNDIIPFRPKVTSKVTPSDHQAAIVEVLEDYLAAAKAGKIKFIALATVDDKDIAFSTWEPQVSSPQLLTSALGALSYLHFRFNASADAGSENDDSLRPKD